MFDILKEKITDDIPFSHLSHISGKLIIEKIICQISSKLSKAEKMCRFIVLSRLFDDPKTLLMKKVNILAMSRYHIG